MGGDRLVGVAAAGGEPVGDGEDRDLGAIRTGGPEVAPDRAAVERALVDEEAEAQVVAVSAPRRSRPAAARRAGGAGRRGRGRRRRCRGRRTSPARPGSSPRVAGFAASCSSAANRIPPPFVSSSPSGSASTRRDVSAVVAALERSDRVEHLERVAVDVERGGRRSARRPAAPSARAARRRAGRSRPSARGRRAPASEVTMRLSSANTRSGATWSIAGACRATAAPVAGSSDRSSSVTSRIARSVRSGSSASAAGGDHPHAGARRGRRGRRAGRAPRPRPAARPSR